MIATTHVQYWTAWAADLPDRASWETWLRHGTPSQTRQATPACAHIPAMLRRRCSFVARMVLEVAFRVCEETHTSPHQVSTIYCSRHGEIQTLRTLLDDLATASPLSPTLFGNAVHHHADGVLEYHGAEPVAFEESFAYGYLEASCILRQYPEQLVLLLVADEILPEPFAIAQPSPPFSYAVGLLLRAEGNEGSIPLRFGRSLPQVPLAPSYFGELVCDFLHWLVCDQDRSRFVTSAGGWQWQRWSFPASKHSCPIGHP